MGGSTAVTGAALAAALLLAGCSGGSSSGSPAASTPATASGGATSTSATPGAASGTTGSIGGATSTRPGPTALAPVPSRTRATLPPAKPSKPVSVGGGARAVLVSSRSVTVTGKGPGELSGPGVALTFQVTNGSRQALDLGAVTVSASVRGEEASASAAAPASPFRGRLAPGARATGVYVFVLPEAARRPVAVVVSLTPDLPVARFTLP